MFIVADLVTLKIYVSIFSSGAILVHQCLCNFGTGLYEELSVKLFRIWPLVQEMLLKYTSIFSSDGHFIQQSGT